MPAVRPARPADNQPLVALAARCPMAGDVSLCVHRQPDFFALNRLAGEPWQVGVVDGDHGPVGCVAVARRQVYLDGRPTPLAYVGDLKVHPDHRRRGIARTLARWALRTGQELTGGPGVAVATVLAGNTAAAGLAHELVPDATSWGTLRSYSIPLLWRHRASRAAPVVRAACPADWPDQAGLWEQLAPARQLAPVALPFARDAAGLDYLVAHHPGGELAGFLGLWDQHHLKQLRVTGYSPRLAATRLVFNAAAPLVRAPRLPPPGGELRYRTVVAVCAADPGTLRALLRHASARLRGSCSFLTVGLDARDRLTTALAGLLAAPTDVTVLVRGVPRPATGDRPLHLEIATV